MPQRPNKRVQVLDAARRCFYRSGIAATGVDAIAAEAGISKRTLYNHFSSKSELVLEYVRWREQQWRADLDPQLAAIADPVERILAYFDSYFFWRPDDEDFRGCAAINMAAEIDDAAVLAELQASKHRVHREMIADAAEAGAIDPEATGTALHLALEGGIALFGVLRDPSGVETAKAVARSLLTAAGAPVPSTV